MDLALLIRQRLRELDLDQKDLAGAAQVTESYISQLLARRKMPPAPARTDIYERIAQFLKLPVVEFLKVVEAQRQQELIRKVADPPGPLFKESRELILRKCTPERKPEVQRIFEKESFGELERLVTQRVLDVSQALAREELRGEEWLRSLAQISGRSFEQMRVAMLEFLDTDVFHISDESCVSFLEPMVSSWDVDLTTFGIEIVLNPRLAPGSRKRFAFVEVPVEQPPATEPGLEDFLKDASLSGDATGEELEFLRALRFKGRRPSRFYYYRELQSLRDQLHFPPLGESGRSA